MSKQDIEYFVRMRTAITANRPLPPDVAAWFLGASDEHLNTGAPLCLCLGIRGAGIRSEKTRELIKRRDVLLNAMQGSVYAPCGPCGSTLWQRCSIVSDMLKRYPRSRNEHNLLRHIFELGVYIPVSKSGIYERVVQLRKSPHFSPSKKSR